MSAVPVNIGEAMVASTFEEPASVGLTPAGAEAKVKSIGMMTNGTVVELLLAGFAPTIE
jgi:hypothetical protein